MTPVDTLCPDGVGAHDGDEYLGHVGAGVPSSVIDELAIRRLLAEYCQRCDDGEFEALADLFTVTGTFEIGNRVVNGRSEIRQWFEAHHKRDRRGKHLTTNLIIDVRGEGANVVSDYVFIALSAGTFDRAVIGRYCDSLRRIEKRWYFERRRCRT